MERKINPEWGPEPPMHSVMEKPYWRDEMTIEEYEIERNYYKMVEAGKMDEYKPLFKEVKVISKKLI